MTTALLPLATENPLLPAWIEVILAVVFVLGGEFLLLHSESIVNKLAGVVAWIFSMAIFGLEIFVQALQAFIFTVLTANYISSAAAEEH